MGTEFFTTPLKWIVYFTGQAESRRMWISECGNKLKEIRAKIKINQPLRQVLVGI